MGDASGHPSYWQSTVNRILHIKRYHRVINSKNINSKKRVLRNAGLLLI